MPTGNIWQAVTSGTYPSLPVTFTPGTYYCATVNAGAISATSFYHITILVSDFYQDGVTCLQPGVHYLRVLMLHQITPSILGQMCYMVLSS